MNTIRSVWFGWGTLIVAGGGAYYFAKRSIASDRAERASADRRRREATRNLEYSASASSASSHSSPSSKPKSSSKHTKPGASPDAGGGELAASPSSEASLDPAPTRHAPGTEGQGVGEKSKYEASEPWRSRKGDRFS
ncbi:MAG: hypothetical protein Q9165_007510 [Trypethelium subeluteriae]